MAGERGVKDVRLYVGTVTNPTDTGGGWNKVITNTAINPTVHREGDLRLNVVDVTQVNSTIVDVISSTKYPGLISISVIYIYKALFRHVSQSVCNGVLLM